MKKSIQETFGEIRDWAERMVSSLQTKQNKKWVNLGSTTGTLSKNISGYTEINVFVGFGGVWVNSVVPVSFIPTTGSKTLYVGYYGGVIYVQVSRTSAKITNQPKDYTGTLQIYAR